MHLGHRALISAAREHARTKCYRTVALTFDPHPAQVLSPSNVPPLLTTIERRKELLLGAGADEVVVQRFDSRFASLSPEAFLRASVIDSLGARALVVGPNFRFGSNRSGDIDTLRALRDKYGFDLLVVDPVRAQGEWVSSSAVRRAIADGDLERAAGFLARFHELTGEVIEGCGRGRTLGVPTANLSCEPVLQPPDGVYAVAARRIAPAAEKLLFGVANLGVRPTFGAGRAVEAHFFDFHGDLYGTRLRLGFVKRLRGERPFQNVDQLRAQIRADSDRARAVLGAIDQEKLKSI